MEILHIWDQAGVACILAKYQSLQGHRSSVISVKDYDRYGITTFYSNYIIYTSPQDFCEICVKEAETADIVHIHSRVDVLFHLRQRFGRSKRIILHYHGTDIRGLNRKKETNSSIQTKDRYTLFDIIPKSKIIARKILRVQTPSEKINFKAQRLADAVLVSTPDLLNLVEKGVYLPNPVDIEHFRPDMITRKSRKEALTIDTEVTDIQWSLNYCRKHNLNICIDVYDRTQKPIMYGEMPDFLKQYELYVDIRYVNKKVLENLSKTALESLACGLRVLDYKLNYHKGLPSEHNPFHVISELSHIYSK
jgi:glycosyltransferase involved in cell wall biosynthesis